MDPTQSFSAGLVTGFIIGISALVLSSHQCRLLQRDQLERILETARATVTVTSFVTTGADSPTPHPVDIITTTQAPGGSLSGLISTQIPIDRLLAGIQYVFSRVAIVFLVLLGLGVIRLARGHLVRVWGSVVEVWEFYHEELAPFDCYN